MWIRNWGGHSGDDASGVRVGADGTVFVSANTNSFGSGSDDGALLRLEPDGKVIDAMTWGGPSIDHADAIDINSAALLLIRP